MGTLHIHKLLSHLAIAEYISLTQPASADGSDGNDKRQRSLLTRHGNSTICRRWICDERTPIKLHMELRTHSQTHTHIYKQTHGHAESEFLRIEPRDIWRIWSTFNFVGFCVKIQLPNIYRMSDWWRRECSLTMRWHYPYTVKLSLFGYRSLVVIAINVIVHITRCYMWRLNTHTSLQKIMQSNRQIVTRANEFLDIDSRRVSGDEKTRSM